MELKGEHSLGIPVKVPLHKACSAVFGRESADEATAAAARDTLRTVREERSCRMFMPQMRALLQQMGGQLQKDVDQPMFGMASTYRQSFCITCLPDDVIWELWSEEPSQQLADKLRACRTSKQLHVSRVFTVLEPGQPQKLLRVLSMLGRKAQQVLEAFP